jgi:hypothetical protein
MSHTREAILEWFARQAKEHRWLASSYWWPLPKIRILAAVWLAWRIRKLQRRRQLLIFTGTIIASHLLAQLRERARTWKRRRWRDADAYHLTTCRYCHQRLNPTGRLLSPSMDQLADASVVDSRASHLCLQAIVSNDAPRLSICFQGAGAVLVYHMGVAAYFQQHFDLSQVAFLGASGGSLPATCLCTELDMDYVRASGPYTPGPWLAQAQIQLSPNSAQPKSSSAQIQLSPNPAPLAFAR